MRIESVKKLQDLVDTVPGLMSAIPDDVFSLKASPDKWSRKEILGHLIDSATNNHQRFIRAQFEDNPKISYDQNKWNIHSHYNEIDNSFLIAFWKMYNQLLLEIIRRMSEEALTRTCYTGGDTPVSLEWLIADYVRHMEHHIRQIIRE